MNCVLSNHKREKYILPSEVSTNLLGWTILCLERENIEILEGVSLAVNGKFPSTPSCLEGDLKEE